MLQNKAPGSTASSSATCVKTARNSCEPAEADLVFHHH
jgi:hypothetical protein